MLRIAGKRYSWHVVESPYGLVHELARRHRGTVTCFRWVAAVNDPDPRKRTLSFLKAQLREAARQIDRRIYVEESRAAEFS